MKSHKRRETYIPPKTRRQKREEEIKRVLAIAHFEKGKPLSMRQIARHMNLWPTSWLMNVLYEMADEGQLLQRTFPQGKSQVRNTFCLPPDRVQAAAARAWAA